MHAIYHSRYNSEEELESAITAYNKILATDGHIMKTNYLRWYRDGLLYDLANRRDEGELRWISPSSYFIHCMNGWYDMIKDLLDRPCEWIKNIPEKD
jgi:hypothetical protein